MSEVQNSPQWANSMVLGMCMGNSILLSLLEAAYILLLVSPSPSSKRAVLHLKISPAFLPIQLLGRINGGVLAGRGFTGFAGGGIYAWLTALSVKLSLILSEFLRLQGDPTSQS